MDDHRAFYAEVGVLIRKQRDELGLTQEALAALVSLTRTSVTNIEKGRQKMLLHTLVDLAAALRVEPAALLPKSLSASSSGKDLEELLKGRPRKTQEWIKSVIRPLEEGDKHGS
jgi:transcriptional regulator with XRE-family HTH domain